MIKKALKRIFSNLHWFFTYLGYKIFLAAFISIVVGVLDGFGLTLFLPLLQMVSGDGTVEAEPMGNLGFILEGINAVGIQITLLSILLFMVFFFSLKGLAVYGNKIYSVALQQQLIRKIRLSLLRSLNQVNFKYFVKSDVGRIQNTMTGEVGRVQQAYQAYFLSLQQLIMVLVYAGFAFFVDFQFALLVAVGGVLTNLLYSSIYKKTKGASRKLTGESNVYQGQVIQHIAHFKYLRATGMARKFSNHLEKTIKKIEQSRKRIGELAGILEAAREPMLISVITAVILIQVYYMGGSLGPILISLLFFYRALTSLTAMQNAWNRFLEVSGSLENMQAFQHELTSNKGKDGIIPFNGLIERIQLKGVCFGYAKIKILKEIDLDIVKNQSIALVGESGSGKTTLVNLIAGLLPAEKGELSVDGISFTQLNKESYQRRIGYITQEPVIFNDSIFNNVTFWAEASRENLRRFWGVMEQASLKEFVIELSEAEHTELGNNGINLSGGQKQRISIARELFKSVDILILDEATSALDTETERNIQDSIEALKGNYTLIIVAHRLSTIKSVDQIVMITEGRVEYVAPFKELMKMSTKFKRMVTLQEI
ncbi:ABC transporter ATP-binding protein [Pleomorphovibrio marinus]|uniref:ABC transporter ATP-binding protein n=1 Tax=Pleomorphovibrio marinus TaxID=2164132 RepID=UPI000E0B2FA1|nr:ABC transporter ATP-binding protein [Pleomorphovibrio marinus]